LSQRSDSSSAQSAEEIEAAAAEWFGRKQFWTWNEGDQIELDAWLDRDLAHRVAFWRLEGAWSRTARIEAVRKPLRLASDAHAYGLGRRKSIRLLAASAAALTIAAGGMYLLAPRNEVGQTYSTAIGERKTLKLADGSEIQLNTNSILEIGIDKNARVAKLEKGEAFFSVRHNAARPFVVTVSGHRITDLGTQFLVRQYGDRVRVSLLEGKALLQSDEQAGQNRVLVPGDVALAGKSDIQLTKHTETEIVNQMSWRSGVLTFDNTTLADAAVEFNRYNTVKLVIDDPSIAKMPVGGKFPVNGVDRFADVITHVFGLHLKSNQASMTITR
jgi:transmembrane sensor